MKAIINIEFTVDGKMDMDQMREVFYGSQGSVITSESVDGTDEWLSLIHI